MSMHVPLLAALPVVDVDATIFLQGGIFVALVLVLKPLLFNPWLEVHAERTASIDGALATVKSLRAEADELSETYESKIRAARSDALRLRSRLRLEEENAQAQMLARKRQEAASQLEQTRGRLAAEAKKARLSLDGNIDVLAQQITAKVLGRSA